MPTAATAEQLIPDQAIKEQGRKWIYGIELFAVGRWNWAKYRKEWTPEDLAGMVEAFEPTLVEIEPVVITNHSDDKDEGKNRGFIGRIYTNTEDYRDDEGRLVPAGHRLLMDVLVDEDLYDDMAAARYRRPSVELYPNYQDAEGHTWAWVVTAASIQGGKHLEAVRVLKPIARTLAAQHYVEHGGQPIVVTFDEGDPMEELKALLEKIAAGMEQLLKSGPKTEPPGPEMAAKPEEEGAKMDQGGAAGAPATVTAPAVAPAATAPASQPTQVVLKYDDQIASLQREVENLKTRAQIAERASQKTVERAAVRAEVAKFAQDGNLKFPPARIDEITEIVLAVPSAGKLVFADATGAKKEGSPRDGLMALFAALPDQTSKTRSQGARTERPTAPATDPVQFCDQVAADAKARGISEDEAWDQALEALPLESKMRLAGMLD